MEQWISEAVGKMHVNKITGIDIAKYLGVTAQYVSEILNGKKTPKNAKEKIFSAIDGICKLRAEICS